MSKSFAELFGRREPFCATRVAEVAPRAWAALFAACMSGDVDALAGVGLDMLHRQPFINCDLLSAAICADAPLPSIAALLGLSVRGRPDATTRDRNILCNAIQWASTYGRLAALRMLLAHPLMAEMDLGYLQPSIHDAACNGHAEVVNALLAVGVAPVDGAVGALAGAQMSIARCCIAHQRFDPATWSPGSTMGRALEMGAAEMVEMLHAHGVRLKFFIGLDSASIVLAACHPELLARVLSADEPEPRPGWLDHVYRLGRPLAHASTCPASVRLLLDAGARPIVDADVVRHLANKPNADISALDLIARAGGELTMDAWQGLPAAAESWHPLPIRVSREWFGAPRPSAPAVMDGLRRVFGWLPPPELLSKALELGDLQLARALLDGGMVPTRNDLHLACRHVDVLRELLERRALGVPDGGHFTVRDLERLVSRIRDIQAPKSFELVRRAFELNGPLDFVVRTDSDDLAREILAEFGRTSIERLVWNDRTTAAMLVEWLPSAPRSLRSFEITLALDEPYAARAIHTTIVDTHIESADVLYKHEGVFVRLDEHPALSWRRTVNRAGPWSPSTHARLPHLMRAQIVQIILLLHAQPFRTPPLAQAALIAAIARLNAPHGNVRPL